MASATPASGGIFRGDYKQLEVESTPTNIVLSTVIKVNNATYGNGTTGNSGNSITYTNFSHPDIKIPGVEVTTGSLGHGLGLAAGIMIYVSFIEMMQLSFESLMAIYGQNFGKLITVTGFVVGLLLMLLIDQLFDHQSIADFISRSEDKNESALIKAGIFSAIALAIHNFPEGFATFTATVYDPAIGLTLASAIAVHNIPEGIAVSVPIYYATKSKRKAFYISFLSGLAEPFGALIGFLIFRTVFNEALFGISFAFCAGIMVYVALNELLPVAKEYGEPSDTIIGVTIGMIIMAISLIMMYS